MEVPALGRSRDRAVEPADVARDAGRGLVVEDLDGFAGGEGIGRAVALFVVERGQDGGRQRVRVVEMQRAHHAGLGVGVILVGILKVIDDFAVERHVQHMARQFRSHMHRRLE